MAAEMKGSLHPSRRGTPGIGVQYDFAMSRIEIETYDGVRADRRLSEIRACTLHIDEKGTSK